MKKQLVLLCIFLLVCVFSFKSADAESRTLYKGYVEIESTSFSNIETQLKSGCKENKKQYGCPDTKPSVCGDAKEQGIAIYPMGKPRGGIFGVGGPYLCVTQNKLWVNQEINGKPSLETYQDEVRKILKRIGLVVRIEEDSWKLVDTKYPYDVMY